MMDINRLIRSDIADKGKYIPVEPVDVLERRIGRKILKLDGNENPYGCSPEVYRALAEYPHYHIYPDPEQRELKELLEQYTGIDRRQILCGAGSDELIDLLLRLFLEPGDEVVNCPPTFGMYPFCTDICGGKIVQVPRKEDFSVDTAAVIKALSEKTKIIFIASPNNPTGNVTGEQDVVSLLDTGKIVVVDEAYFEFSNITMAGLVRKYNNLVILRTFSKWAGLAGLRVGYGFFPEEIVEHLMRIKQPYNVNIAAQVAVKASLLDMDYLQSNISSIISERERLFALLKDLKWLEPYPSQGNFLLCLLLKGAAQELWSRLRERGIFVRYFDEQRLQNCLRISAGRPEDSDALLEALRDIEPVV